jgi:hypothetical protein
MTLMEITLRARPSLTRAGYISLCEDQFKNEQAKIHWALSFMKSRCAALYVNSILRNEASQYVPSFLSW